MGVPESPVEVGVYGSNSSQNMKLQIAAVTWRISTWSDSAFYQITLVLVMLWQTLTN